MLIVGYGGRQVQRDLAAEGEPAPQANGPQPPLSPPLDGNIKAACPPAPRPPREVSKLAQVAQARLCALCIGTVHSLTCSSVMQLGTGTDAREIYLTIKALPSEPWAAALRKAELLH
ncbi:unnamed protein product [Symbiodinium natans]|uniref:Uncharacterized protein n=1 Tax=Symbiodinium natans TaxID=878477 RepID=A0A812KLA1_9DINO|nr:unnamed protein product [Symbiodinium natans]